MAGKKEGAGARPGKNQNGFQQRKEGWQDGRKEGRRQAGKESTWLPDRKKWWGETGGGEDGGVGGDGEGG